jgi:ribonuclease I
MQTASEDPRAAKHHDFRVHDQYTDENSDPYRQLDDVPDDELRERWLMIYKNVGNTWTHPKVHEARKNGIVRVLRQADYFLDLDELHDRLNEMLQSNVCAGRNISKDALKDDPGYLDELVEEERIERDGTTWGVDAPRAKQLVTATG